MPPTSAPTSPPAGPHYIVMFAGSLGDTYPFIALAKALRARGRAVLIMGTVVHADAVQRCGLPFVGIGTDEDYLQTIRNPDLWDPRKGFATLFRDYGAYLEQAAIAAARLMTEHDCILVAHPLVLPAAAILRAEHPALRIVGAYLAPAGLRTCHDPLRIGHIEVASWVPRWLRRMLWRLADFAVVDRVAVPEVNAARRSFALPPIRHFIAHMQGVPDVTVTLFPSWFARTHEDWPRPLVHGDFQWFDPAADKPLPADLADFLARGDAPLVVTPGSANVHGAGLFALATHAVAALGRRAIFLTPHRAQVPATLPETIFWLPYVPLGTLLPNAAAIVHHGGIGTTAEALRAGVPQLVTPFAWDQFDNAARVTRLGVGVSLSARRLDGPRLRAALLRISTDDAMRDRCADVAARCRQRPTTAELCCDIEGALAG